MEQSKFSDIKSNKYGDSRIMASENSNAVERADAEKLRTATYGQPIRLIMFGESEFQRLSKRHPHLIFRST